MMRRTDALAAAGEEFDVCIIGGGATGAGCALDARLRGLKTILVEANDFASATSSASTKLIHGGIRYLREAALHLDFGQVGVVKRALGTRLHAAECAVSCWNNGIRYPVLQPLGICFTLAQE